MVEMNSTEDDRDFESDKKIDGQWESDSEHTAINKKLYKELYANPSTLRNFCRVCNNYANGNTLENVDGVSQKGYDLSKIQTAGLDPVLYVDAVHGGMRKKAKTMGANMTATVTAHAMAPSSSEQYVMFNSDISIEYNKLKTVYGDIEDDAAIYQKALDTVGNSRFLRIVNRDNEKYITGTRSALGAGLYNVKEKMIGSKQTLSLYKFVNNPDNLVAGIRTAGHNLDEDTVESIATTLSEKWSKLIYNAISVEGPEANEGAGVNPSLGRHAPEYQIFFDVESQLLTSEFNGDSSFYTGDDDGNLLYVPDELPRFKNNPLGLLTLCMAYNEDNWFCAMDKLKVSSMSAETQKVGKDGDTMSENALAGLLSGGAGEKTESGANRIFSHDTLERFSSSVNSLGILYTKCPDMFPENMSLSDIREYNSVRVENIRYVLNMLSEYIYSVSTTGLTKKTVDGFTVVHTDGSTPVTNAVIKSLSDIVESYYPKLLHDAKVNSAISKIADFAGFASRDIDSDLKKNM
ncbi:MAG: hypothetical protein HUJ62_08700, partial [Streptococcus gallolyticus]|nr:hypothetical protein [Streptococcus gallolyticus]